MNELSSHYRERVFATLKREEGSFVSDTGAKKPLSEDELIRIRKDRVVKFLKEKYSYISYVVLAMIVWMAVKIRTRNLGGLRDVTTGSWTLGPDLDPFFFLRLAKYIVANGTLFLHDSMRYVPRGFDMAGEYLLHPYMMAWFHKLASVFGSESVTHSAVLYPVFMFALTVIAFFLMTKKMFSDNMGEKNANIIALIASFFLSVIPSLLPRTIAGIPEKESAAFFFLFMAFYLFLSAWKYKGEWRYGGYVLAALSGLASAGMAHIWGGYIFIFLVIAPVVFIAYLLGKVDSQRIKIYSLWILFSFIGMVFVFQRYSMGSYLKSATSSGLAVIVLVIMLIHLLVYKTKLYDKIRPIIGKGKISKLPPKIVSLIISILTLVIVASIVFGPSFVPSTLLDIKDTLIKPATSRLIQTVAENRQPYFTEWARSFGPIYRGIPVLFWIFFVGSIYMFYKMIRKFRKKERKILTASYIILLFSVIFSRHSSNSTLNGENGISIFIYMIGFVIFLVTFGYYYYKHYKNGESEVMKSIDSGFLLLFVLFFISVVAARAAVRTIMVLVPSASAIVGYFVVSSINDLKKIKDSTFRVIGIIFVILLLISTLYAGYGFYQSVNAQSRGYVPSIYTQQWQRAMGWVRENTNEDAVFGHWWDYGYWLQSMGERATVLDGGNAMSYWNHMMGRYALTGTDSKEAAEFLYVHNTTHFLIDSTDIGKYSAFSTIGSDASYDRASYIPQFSRDNNQIQEKKNSTVFIYSGGVGIDEDIVYDDNGTKLFLPAGEAGLGGILIEKDTSGGKIVAQPLGVFVYQGQQYTVPFRYAFENEFMDFGSGIEAGVFIFPRAIQSSGGVQLEPDGALFYLSKRTVKSQLARLYLYKEDDPYFKLVHSEDDFFVNQIKSQNPGFDSDFISYQGLRGPIRIWELNYPEEINYRSEFMDTKYPQEILYGR